MTYRRRCKGEKRERTRSSFCKLERRNTSSLFKLGGVVLVLQRRDDSVQMNYRNTDRRTAGTPCLPACLFILTNEIEDLSVVNHYFAYLDKAVNQIPFQERKH